MSKPETSSSASVAVPNGGGPWAGLAPFRKGEISFEEFLALIPDGEKADLLDGVIYMASPDNTDANDLTVWLCVILAGFVEAKRLGKVYISRVAYRIGAKRGPEPDLGFVPKELEQSRQRGYIDGPPALAIEIVSPDSVARDYVLKRAIYEQAGVREYWILDPDEKRATFLSLREGHYEESPPVDDVFTSLVLPGMRLDVRWFWDQSRPAAYEVLGQFLQSS
jgi:Uma2 family endonuclease